MIKRGEGYQIVLIFSALAVAALFGVFLYREIFPEYKIYQNDYIKLEEFRSTYTGQPIPPFAKGVKQIVLEREDKGPPVIDRCVSCHVALEIPAFSPTKVLHDSQGQVVHNTQGFPVLVANEEFIWNKLDQAIADLRDEKANEHFKQQGESAKVAQRLEQAAAYEALKTAHVGEHRYSVEKVLAMHPLIGKETRPFEFHPVAEYGCTSCHNGNGNGLTTNKAHGPVFDGQYEVEFVGEVPQFIESDPINDPRFSKVFNGKPGHDLLFQTRPIYVGGLIQAKCVQCHQTSQAQADMGIANGFDPLLQKSVDDLTKNYQQGRSLYIEQACYACHKIAALSRGGVGPELTNEGNSYPWYIKQKIVWPQSDLKTSTMPNMRLDHEEVEDLMTFMLAQKGSNQAVGHIPYYMSVQKWESGRKQPWEKPVDPAQIFDLNYSLTVFATEGCAACHRLKGYESNVGYAIEKNKPSFEQLYQEHQWFQKLFPEMISASELVAVIETHAKELDEKIEGHIRQHAILEEIEKNHPRIIESFYEPFKYALRAKNHSAKTPEELSKWKERVRRVMMMFIQEYGLGRLIGPRPNWSGIYRTDEWLMEHFRNPASLVPRSLMPIFPFDDTKFYALTYLLDTLAVRNRNAVQKIWDTYGFNPALAYSLHCSQCHGEFLQGNGPIAQWIYPIPKNLTSGEFLRNLTKENATISIHHGVKGTPMPPWGDVAQDKPHQIKDISGDKPILTSGQINELVNWLFASLPGGDVIRGEQDVFKWQYKPEDAIKELEKEGNLQKLKVRSTTETSEKKKKEDIVSLATIPLPKDQQEKEVEEIFDEVPNAIPDDENKTLYYIKKKYYNEHNIEEGKRFFMINCASCHGAEGDGSGARAAAMAEAKPRMLTNLNWIRTRDDLRLLRSIKYGVPGTAMTPWGDLTNSLLRMQLVVFIRSLSEEQDRRDRLNTALYETYSTAMQTIDEARLSENRLIQQYLKSYNQAQAIHQETMAKVEHRQVSPEAAVKVYQKYLAIGIKLHQEQAIDQSLIDLKNEIRQERNIYQNLGVELIAQNVSDATFQQFLELITLNAKRYAMENGRLNFMETPDMAQKISSLEVRIIKDLDAKIDRLVKESSIVEGKIVSHERTAELKEIEADIKSSQKLKEKLTSSINEAILSRQNQKKLYDKLKPEIGAFTSWNDNGEI